ncbi:MAG: MFS transporter [Reyranella sp.]
MTDPGALPPDAPTNRWPLLRWYISSGTLGVPQAAGPVAFSLVALSLTGDTSGGAAIVLAMTLAQVGGAIPIARLGGSMPLATFLRLLVGVRTVALFSLAVCATNEAPFAWLVGLAAVAGLVNGAASGYLRAVLSHLAPESRRPRALGIAATLNEVAFVLGPVAASGLGSVSPVFAVFVLAAVGAVPALLVPNTGATHIDGVRGVEGSILEPSILLWLACAAAGGAAIAAIEIGAVALALNFGYEPTLAIAFTVPLCLASVAGGIWVSVRNRMATRGTVLVQLLVMTLGSSLAAVNFTAATTIVGTILMGSVIAPLATHYSLILETLTPPQRRPEVFALLRTANAIGVILASAVLTVVSLSMALIVVTGLMIIITLAVLVGSASR